jgi:hypothetical protein
MAVPRCVYCGAALGADTVASAAAAREATLAPPPPEGPPRTLIVVDAEADPAALARALGESAYEGAQRVRRGGLHLWRLVAAAEGEAETARLRETGITAWTVTEADVKKGQPPLGASRGSGEGGTLHLVTGEGKLALGARDLLLVVKGPIAREYQTEGKVRRVSTASLEPGYRFHLHRRDDPRPVELDPAEIDLGRAPLLSSAQLQLAAWIEEAAQGVPVDDGFRRLPPALGTAQATSLATALGGRAAGRSGRPSERVVLDNLAQFHFYSAWRGAVERLR